MKPYVLLLILIFVMGCKKEGLTRDTANVEIMIPRTQVSLGKCMYYDIYTEEQYYRFLNYQWPFTPYRGGGETVNKITEKGMPKGSYGIHMVANGIRYTKLFYVSANKLNKITFP